ncbi:MAG: esterase/lipase family protein [Reyranella sp.]
MRSAVDPRDYDFESPEGVRPPGFHLRLLEARAPYEALSSLALWPLLQKGPRGDGHPVLVLPGLVAHDSSTRMLRNFLIQRGFAAHGWGQGINFGPHPHVVEACVERIRFLHRQSGGRKVSLVGQSLGGVYARVLAFLAEDSVRCVITLGSPITGSASASNAQRLYQAVSGRHAHHPAYSALLKRAPHVPTTSIFSRSDGVVAWQASVMDEHALAENIEVQTSHTGMALHPAVLHAVADRLAQPEGQWKTFQRDGLLQWIYGNTQRLRESAPATA